MKATYSDQQLIEVSLKFYSKIQQLRSGLLGNDFNDRRLAILLLLGARHLKAKADKQMQPMTKGRLEELIARQLEVTTRTAMDDVDAMVKEGFLTIDRVPGDARQKEVLISETGLCLYHQFTEQSVDVIVATAKWNNTSPTSTQQPSQDL